VNGVHDMGGAHGFGPIENDPDEPLFHAAWEGRARAIVHLSMSRGYFNVDAFRYGIERMAPAEYLRAPYFERWITSGEYNLVQQGLVTTDEVDARVRELCGGAAAGGTAIGGPNGTPWQPTPSDLLPELTPRFAVGDAVVTRNVHPTTHTRLPRYARGKRGVVQLVHGPQVFPDTHAHGCGANPQVLYNVRFEAAELWGESAEPRQQVSIDLWESYLEAAT
jgi:nitrile hydratase beta subunit